MQDKDILFCELTLDGEKVDVVAPVYEKVMDTVIYQLVGEDGEPVERHGANYCMVYKKAQDGAGERLMFEGKQNDFFYVLEIESTEKILDLELEADKIIEIINSDVWRFDLKWWEYNDKDIMYDQGVCVEGKKLTYEIKLTDLISVKVAVHPFEICDDIFDNTGEFAMMVRAGEYSLRAYKR